MRLKDFKYFFVIVLICLIIGYFMLSCFVFGYEEETNNTPLAGICYKILGLLVFSVEFWAEKIGFPGILAIAFAFITTSLLVSILLLTLKLLYKSIFTGRNHND